MIVTEYVAPPVSTNAWDWMAYMDDADENSPTGRGATECEALRDLCEQLASYYEPDISAEVNRAHEISQGMER